MSLTGRPSRPPLALTSSSQIFCASSADLPLAASPPVIAMLKPILIGSPDCAAAPSAANAATAATATADTAEIKDVNRKTISVPPNGLRARFSLCARILELFQRPAPAPARAAAAPSLRRGVAGFDDDRLDLAGAGATERRGLVVFLRFEAGDALRERRKLDHHEAVKLVRPLHDLIAPAAGEDLAAELGDDAGDPVGVLLVFDGVDDAGA